MNQRLRKEFTNEFLSILREILICLYFRELIYQLKDKNDIMEDLILISMGTKWYKLIQITFLNIILNVYV